MGLRLLRERPVDQRAVHARRRREAGRRVQALRRDGGPRRARRSSSSPGRSPSSPAPSAARTSSSRASTDSPRGTAARCMRALLISTYELGRQPYGLASPAAWLRRAGWDVVCADVTRERLQRASIEAADLVGFHLPMHTATRLAGPVIRKVREINPSARVCAYGLYAPLNGDWLRSIGVDAVFGGEFEEESDGVRRGCERRQPQRAGRGPPADSLPRARSQRAPALRPSTLCFTWATGVRRSSDQRTPAAGASTSAGTVRWCRSIAGSSASCRRTSSWRISMPRSRPAPSTSPSATPISSTVRRTRCGSWTHSTRRIPTSPMT